MDAKTRGQKMVGRKKEIAELEKLYGSKKAELVAIYGRRRVGKTYLVNQFFSDRFFFKHAGLAPEESDSGNELSRQLDQFYLNLLSYGLKKEKKPDDWFEAFFLLRKLITEKDDGSRMVVFIDELPWLDTKKSNFIKAFEGFWNSFGCAKDNLMLIVCGSATSWMENNLINDHGGLYGRVTYEIKLAPFSLAECEEFFEAKGIAFSQYEITLLHGSWRNPILFELHRWRLFRGPKPRQPILQEERKTEAGIRPTVPIGFFLQRKSEEDGGASSQQKDRIHQE